MMNKSIKFATLVTILFWCGYSISFAFLGWFVTSLIMVVLLFPTSLILSDVIEFIIQWLPYSIGGVSVFHIFLCIFSTLHIFLVSLGLHYLVEKCLFSKRR